MKFPIMEADLGLGSSGGTSHESVTSDVNEGVQVNPEVNQQGTAVNEQVNSGPPESIPYERFREVNDRAKQAEQQATMAMQYMQHMLLQQQQQMNAMPQPQQQQVAYDPYEELAKFQEDPRAYLSSLRDEIKQETLTEFQRTSQAEQAQRTAFNQALTKFPELNDEKGKYWTYANAHSIAQQIQGDPRFSHVSWDQIFEYSAKEISDFRNGGRADGLREAQSRNQQKIDAFTEGASNIVPKSQDSFKAQIEKAKQSGDVNAMVRLKLQALDQRAQ